MTRGLTFGWLGLLVLLAGTALVKRHSDHLRLQARLVAELRQIAEVNHNDVYDYLWGADDRLWPSRLGSPQSAAIYLLNHGYASHSLERGLLLCEAMRVYDWKYLYPSVNNYDLRWKLIDHCLRVTTEDPQVDVAVGELSLAAGDFGLASSALGGVLDLKSRPGELHALCQGLGISEQHLHGRYACALMLTGDSQAADAQAALAAQADDGAAPPPLEDWSYEYGTDDEKTALDRAAEAARRNAAIARQYGLQHNPAIIRLWLDESAAARSELAAADKTADNGELASLLFGLDKDLLRAYLLAHQWDKAAGISADMDRLLKAEQSAVYDDAPLRYQTGLLLTRLARGEKLGLTADETAEAQRPELEKSYSGIYQTLTPEQRQQEIEATLNYYRVGELSGLLEADYLPFLLRTDGFADALKKSGRTLDDVLTEIQAVTQPERGTYSDSSNGTLRWK